MGTDQVRKAILRGDSEKAIKETWQKELEEYRSIRKNYFTRPRWFDLLMGTDQVRKAILRGDSEKAIKETWQKELEEYRSIRKNYILYH